MSFSNSFDLPFISIGLGEFNQKLNIFNARVGFF
ncbi:MAG: hypothetical protein RLZZ361_1277, partial [Cyanobacteriota bacterium]